MKILWTLVILFLLCTVAVESGNAAYAVAWIFLACLLSVIFGFTLLLSDMNAFGHFFRGMLLLGVIMAVIQMLFGWPMGYRYADKVTTHLDGSSQHITDTGANIAYDDHGNMVHFIEGPRKPCFNGETVYLHETYWKYHYTGSGKDAWDRQIEISGYQGDVPTTSVWVKVNGEIKVGE